VDVREALSHLRSIVARADHAALVTALRDEPWPHDSLQLIGDGLLASARDKAQGSADLAHTCANALRERDWEGDPELAEVLDAATGSGPTPMLRPLPVDLEELAMVLEGDPIQGGGRIDLSTGEVWPQTALEYAEEVGDLDGDDAAPTGGYGFTARARATAIGTWSGSSTSSTTRRSPLGWPGRSPGAAPSTGSRASCPSDPS
jgi:hypothetical protein